jgi:hypothetical protein
MAPYTSSWGHLSFLKGALTNFYLSQRFDLKYTDLNFIDRKPAIDIRICQNPFSKNSKNYFKRFYLPQVDGLRFVAIFMVVCIAHIRISSIRIFSGNFVTGYWCSLV